MKKKFIIIALICILAILIIPIPSQLNDGGSVQYTAILYRITKYHRINEQAVSGYTDGIGIKILGFEVFNNCRTVMKTENELENITTDIKDITPSSATLIITDNNSPMKVYGAWYRIDKQVNNEWVELKPIIDEYGFNDLGYMGNEETKQVIFDVKWEWLYGKLPQGKYRIVKEVGNKYIYASFNIEN